LYPCTEEDKQLLQKNAFLEKFCKLQLVSKLLNSPRLLKQRRLRET